MNFFSNKSKKIEASSEPQKLQYSATEYCEQGQKSLDAEKYVEAMEFFQAAIEADNHFEKAYLLLATAYERQGKTDKAKATLYGLLAFNPNHSEALKRVQEVSIVNNAEAAANHSHTTNNINTTSTNITTNATTQNLAPLSSHEFDVSVDSGLNKLYFKIYGDEAAVVAPNNCEKSWGNMAWNGYKKPVGKVMIPSEIQYNGSLYKVARIGNRSFVQCDEISEVDIPNSVIAIGNNAFCGCKNLRLIIIPSSVISIGEYAFSHCSIHRTNIPSSVLHIGAYAFSHNLLHVFAFPEGIQEVDASVVYCCRNLTSVVFPSTVKTMTGYWGSDISNNYLMIMKGIPPVVRNSIEDSIRVEVPENLFEKYRNEKYWQNCDLKTRKRERTTNIDTGLFTFNITKALWLLLYIELLVRFTVQLFDEDIETLISVGFIFAVVLGVIMYKFLYLIVYRRDNFGGDKFGEGKYNHIVFNPVRNIIFIVFLFVGIIALVYSMCFMLIA